MNEYFLILFTPIAWAWFVMVYFGVLTGYMRWKNSKSPIYLTVTNDDNKTRIIDIESERELHGVTKVDISHEIMDVSRMRVFMYYYVKGIEGGPVINVNS